jgi:hypothetical protein
MKKQHTHNIALVGFLIPLVILFFCMTTANANYYDDQEKLKQEGQKYQNYIDNQKSEAKQRAYEDDYKVRHKDDNNGCCVVAVIILAAGGILLIIKSKSKNKSLPKTGGKICPGCRKTIQVDAVYCDHCGTKVYNPLK